MEVAEIARSKSGWKRRYRKSPVKLPDIESGFLTGLFCSFLTAGNRGACNRRCKDDFPCQKYW